MNSSRIKSFGTFYLFVKENYVGCQVFLSNLECEELSFTIYNFKLIIANDI